MNESLELLNNTLKEKGYKLTPQRKAVLEVILSTKGKHLTSEEIYDIVKETKPENWTCNGL